MRLSFVLAIMVLAMAMQTQALVIPISQQRYTFEIMNCLIFFYGSYKYNKLMFPFPFVQIFYPKVFIKKSSFMVENLANIKVAFE